jgi:hypothetical protein
MKIHELLELELVLLDLPFVGLALHFLVQHLEPYLFWPLDWFFVPTCANFRKLGQSKVY